MNIEQDKPRLKTSPQDVFVHLLMIVALYMSVVSFITLYFQYINVLLPDKLIGSYASIYGGIRFASSMLIIAIPVFLLMSWLLEKDFKQNVEKHEFKFRKWLIYLTLFLASLTIIIDLIQLVNNFYGGELTIKFFLKVLVVLIVAGIVFWYYLWDLKRKEFPSKKSKSFAWAVSLLVIFSIIWGFFLVGTPAHQRQVRFDETRVSDLQVIQGQIVNYWVQKNQLPQNLDNLKDSISGFVSPQDPETNIPYEYIIKGALSFDLCTNFKTENKNVQNIKSIPITPVENYSGPYSDSWNHGTGRVCFERTIDPQLYKKTTNTQ